VLSGKITVTTENSRRLEWSITNIEDPDPSGVNANGRTVLAYGGLRGYNWLHERCCIRWNCKHLANASHRSIIETVAEEADYACPIICTPEELMED